MNLDLFHTGWESCCLGCGFALLLLLVLIVAGCSVLIGSSTLLAG
jgi:hypothetical protein